MPRRFWSAIICLVLCVPAQAGQRSQARFTARAASAISTAPVPPDAVGVAYSRQVRFNWIPFAPPLGAFGILGRSATFDRDTAGSLSNPRISRIAGGGVVAMIGVGLPWSVGAHSEVRSFATVAQRESFATGTHLTGSAGVYAAAGVPGKLWSAQAGPKWDTRPGRVVWQRDRFVGLFASAGAQAGGTIQWPTRSRAARGR